MLIIVAAYDEQRRATFSKTNPLSFVNDPEFFKKITINNQILFGESTQKLIGSPLPNRKTMVLSNKITVSIKGVEGVYDPDVVVQKYAKNTDEDIYICGGINTYKKFIDYADKLIIYHIKKANKSLNKFPTWDISSYSEIVLEETENYIKKEYTLLK